MKDLDNGAYVNESYVAHISKGSTVVPLPSFDALLSPRHARRRQRGTVNVFAGSLFVVEEVTARVGPTIYHRPRCHRRGYWDSICAQSRERP
jgi:hypothetical protein